MTFAATPLVTLASCADNGSPDVEGACERPTSIPDFDVEAFAVSTFARPRGGALPLDLAVPVRVGTPAEGTLDHVTAFVFLHVDGRLSITELAAHAGIAVPEAIGAVLNLVGAGVIDLVGREPRATVPPQSGVARCHGPTSANDD